MDEQQTEMKEYLSCDLIEHGFDFSVDAINFCCRTTEDGGGFTPLIPNYKGEKIDWDKFFETKNSHRKKMRENNIIPECKGCIHLYKKAWDTENYISHINFNNWTVCNAKCIYCYLTYLRSKKQNPKSYAVFPIIKDLINKKLLRTDGNITIAGGEPTIIGEFEKVLNMLLDYGVKDIRINTNAIKYSKAIEKGIKKGVISLVSSVDSGTREKFKLIKSVDKHNDVWKNMQKYCNAQVKDYQVKTKLIILPGINTTTEEVDAWIDKSKKIGLKYIAVDIELNWYFKNKDNLPKELFEIFNHIIKKAEENELKIEYQDRAEMLLNKINKGVNV